MPKPFLLPRRSGLYARFFVPTDLQGVVGSRYLVRPLHLPPGDAARLVSAYMGMALSNAFQALRQGKSIDLDEVLRRIREQGLRELTLTDVTLPNGTHLGRAQIDTPEDAALFAELLREPAAKVAAPPNQAAGAPVRPKRLARCCPKRLRITWGT
ncbi:TPA: hypothetical protein NKO30_006798 [Pseudomonas aeruginosa]|nr:hypothetical protein [Pseudomonas aeruginosa]